MKWFNLYLIIFNRRHTSCKLTQQQHKATTPLLASHLSTVVVTRFFGSLSSFVGPSLGYPFFFTAIIRHRPERVQHLWYTTPSLFKWNHISYFPTMADKNYHQGESRVCLDMSCLCRCLNEISNTLIAPISTHNSTMQPLYQFKTHNNTITITYHKTKGHDPKSLALNLATLLLFLLPFALYHDYATNDSQNVQMYMMVVVGSLVFSLVVPPAGWMRPHPYTDMPGNEPLRFRKSS